MRSLLVVDLEQVVDPAEDEKSPHQQRSGTWNGVVCNLQESDATNNQPT